MDSNRELDIANAQVLIGLWQQEERRLHEIISNPLTAPEIRNQANDKLGDVLRQIRETSDELTKLEFGR
jgi:hypothetical protein